MELKELEKRIEEALTELGALRKAMEKLEEENRRLNANQKNYLEINAELQLENEEQYSMLEDLADSWLRADLDRRKLWAKYEEGREMKPWEKR